MIGSRALLLSAAATALVCPIAIRHLRLTGLLDMPNHRSSHVSPTPRGGGIACATGIGVAAAAAQVAGHDVAWTALAGAGALAGLGRLDDIHGLPPFTRLIAQGVVGGVMGHAFLGGTPGAVVGAAVTSVAVNTTNFMDGINGMSGLTAALWGASVMRVGASTHRGALVELGAATAGAGLGFLPYNMPQASLFLGDVGSYLFGGAFAAGILSQRDGWSAMACIAPLSVYLTDTGSTVVRRARRGSPLTEAHREHVYQRLVSQHGWTHAQSAALAAGISAVITVAVHKRSVTGLAASGLLLAGYSRLPEILRWAVGVAS